MNIKFYKYQGTGNDFIIIDNRKETFIKDTEYIRKLCDRKFGIGADGLVLLEDYDSLDFEMKYFNADGKESSLCGNAGRCIVAFARKLGLIKKDVRFKATDGIHDAKALSNNYVRIKMRDITKVIIEDDYFFIDTGSPHYVKFVDEIEDFDVYNKGKKIRNSKKFAPDGVNANFVMLGRDSIFVRTFERGVENETLSCGTGVVAAAISVALKQDSDKNSYTIHTLGGDLIVSFTRDSNNFRDIWLEGPAILVFEGNIL